MAAGLVLMPHAPLGLVTEGVQSLAGVLLPSATVFLLLLCNDKAVLGPWVNGLWTNIFTGAVIAVLVTLSIVLTASVLFPEISGTQILWILGGGVVLSVIVGGVALATRSRESVSVVSGDRRIWRMPRLAHLPPAVMGRGTKIWMAVLRGYLVVAVGLVIVRLVQLAMAG